MAAWHLTHPPSPPARPLRIQYRVHTLAPPPPLPLCGDCADTAVGDAPPQHCTHALPAPPETACPAPGEEAARMRTLGPQSPRARRLASPREALPGAASTLSRRVSSLYSCFMLALALSGSGLAMTARHPPRPRSAAARCPRVRGAHRLPQSSPSCAHNQQNPGDGSKGFPHPAKVRGRVRAVLRTAAVWLPATRGVGKPF